MMISCELHIKNGICYIRKDGLGENRSYNKLVEFYLSVSNIPKEKFLSFDIDTDAGWITFEPCDGRKFYHFEKEFSEEEQKKFYKTTEGYYKIEVYFTKTTIVDSKNKECNRILSTIKSLYNVYSNEDKLFLSDSF